MRDALAVEEPLEIRVAWAAARGPAAETIAVTMRTVEIEASSASASIMLRIPARRASYSSAAKGSGALLPFLTRSNCGRSAKPACVQRESSQWRRQIVGNRAQKRCLQPLALSNRFDMCPLLEQSLPL